MMPNFEMDQVDQRQQREIDATRIWTRVLGVLTVLLTLASLALFALFMETRSCPHAECPHHRTLQ